MIDWCDCIVNISMKLIGEIEKIQCLSICSSFFYRIYGPKFSRWVKYYSWKKIILILEWTRTLIKKMVKSGEKYNTTCMQRESIILILLIMQPINDNVVFKITSIFNFGEKFLWSGEPNWFWLKAPFIFKNST